MDANDSDTERKTRIEVLERRFQEIEGNIKTSRYGNLCSILCKLIQCCNTIILALLIAFSVVEFLRIRKLEGELQQLQAEQSQVAQLQSKINDLQSSLPNSTKQEVQIQELDEKVQKEQAYTNYVLSGVFTLLSCLISMFHMSSHLSKMIQPVIQQKIISILWMSPIYSVTSFLSLLFPSIEGPMKIIKDFYESFCIYQFLSFMILVLGGGSREQAVANLSKHAGHLQTPSRCLKRFYDPPPDTSDQAKANAVITECQIFSMQFVFIRPLTSILWVIFVLNPSVNSNEDSPDSSDDLDEDATDNFLNNLTRALQNATNAPSSDDSQDPFGNNNSSDFFDTLAPTLSPTLPPALQMLGDNATSSPQETEELVEAAKSYFTSLPFAIAMVVNVSVFFAFLGLLKFYHAVRDDLEWVRPWPKFLTIKGVVFLTFWQGLAINILVHLEENPGEDASLKAREYQNTLICLEMLFFSISHWCVFPSEEWERDYRRPEKVNTPGLGISDFVSDVSNIVKSGARKSSKKHPKRRKRGRRARADSAGVLYEKSPTEADDGLSNNQYMGQRMYDFEDDFSESNPRGRTFSNESSLASSMEDSESDNELI